MKITPPICVAFTFPNDSEADFAHSCTFFKNVNFVSFHALVCGYGLRQVMLGHQSSFNSHWWTNFKVKTRTIFLNWIKRKNFGTKRYCMSVHMWLVNNDSSYFSWLNVKCLSPNNLWCVIIVSVYAEGLVMSRMCKGVARSRVFLK